MNARQALLRLGLSALLALTAVAGLPPEATAAREARMAWWREARFGMFVHWGLYSGLAGTWQGKAVGTRGGMEWIQQRVKADTYEYAHEAIPRFQPKPGFAREWARVAKQAGCKYVVFTSKHHDGFALHQSATTDYDAGDVTGRDLVREIVDALRAEGLRVGFYHSVIDWHHPQYDYAAAEGLPHPLAGRSFPNGPRDHSLYLDYLHGQVRELVSNYGTVDVLWWDYSKPGAEGEFWRADALVRMVKNHQPDIIMNNRLYRIPHIEKEDSVDRLKTWKPTEGDFTTPEQTVPSTGIPGVDWEACMTMNTSWGYSDHDDAWKSAEQLIRHLVDIASKGGNYLLNVGPKADGSIPPESVERMAAIGAWMRVNGEAIYGTTASPLAEPGFDGRVTAKDGLLFLHVFDRPADGRIHLPRAVQSARFLGATESLNCERMATGTVISLPAALPDPVCSVIRVELR
ncbi:MAG: alpha-L-fucosidase [Verrucomicrobiales bacterium]|nr:alpha-L-fucosidase [Verrucomicrobiales bacterium]